MGQRSIHDAAWDVANAMSDIQSTGGALIACVKQILQAKDTKFPLRESLADMTQRFESVLNRTIG